MLDEKEWKYVAKKISLADRAIYFFQLLKTNLLSETTVSQAQSTFIWLNSTIIIKCKICSKLTIEATDVVLLSLLLTLNIFIMLF